MISPPAWGWPVIIPHLTESTADFPTRVGMARGCLEDIIPRDFPTRVGMARRSRA